MTVDDSSPVKPRPYRVQLRRTKGWRKPDNTVVVARPSQWGNPFRVAIQPDSCGMWSVTFQTKHSGPYWCDEYETHAEAVAGAVDFYRDWATKGPDHYLRALMASTGEDTEEVLITTRMSKRIHRSGVMIYVDQLGLRGKNLACWCPLDSPCHADVLLELANREVE